MLTIKNNISYEILTVKDLDEATDVLIDSFSQNEPMAICLNLARDEYVIPYRMICEAALTERLSIIARDVKSGRIVGCMINEDYAAGSLLKDIEPDNTGSFMPIISLLDQLNKLSSDATLMKTGECFHLYMLGVHKNYTTMKYNIPFAFMEIGMDLARSKGFKYMLIEATGYVTQKGAELIYKFKTLAFINYKTFIYNDKYCFKKIEKPESCKLMLKEL